MKTKMCSLVHARLAPKSFNVNMSILVNDKCSKQLLKEISSLDFNQSIYLETLE